MRILVVDDSPPIQAYLCQIITQLGHECLGAKDGNEALAGFLEGKPDCILLDVELPDMSGFEVARRIRGEEGGLDWTPIIFLTGLASDQSLVEGIEAGGDDYLTKPVSEVVLGAKIGAMRRIKRMRDQLLVVTQQLEQANQRLQALAAVDGLTGLSNRRHFDEHYPREWARARRERTSISVVMLDVDHFKQYNDTYGHQLGDDCLRRIAAVFGREARRPGDVAARYGGEEFVLVLPATDSAGARHVAANIKNAISGLAIEHKASKAADHVTASIGVATADPDRFEGDPAALLRLADQALYEAKHRGRNRVVWVDTTGAAAATA